MLTTHDRETFGQPRLPKKMSEVGFQKSTKIFLIKNGEMLMCC